MENNLILYHRDRDFEAIRLTPSLRIAKSTVLKQKKLDLAISYYMFTNDLGLSHTIKCIN